MRTASGSRSNYFLGRVGEIVRGQNSQPAFGKQCPDLFDISTLTPGNYRNTNVHLPYSLDDAFSYQIAAHDTAKDIDRNGSHR